MTPSTRFPSRLSILPTLVLAALVTTQPALSQVVQGQSASAEVALLLRQMDGVKRVLMIAAHPDDEDSSLLAALSRGLGAETAYLSLTRGDGGQNLIGPELGEGLGVVRTGELEAARRLDGGAQFFTRAYDFGYTKSADETLRFWAEDEVLADAVWIVRTFRPQVIVSQWSGTPRDGHGQHQASGIVARQAFEAAADPNRFPEQLIDGVEPWQAGKLYIGFRRSPEEATAIVSTGDFDALLGRSWFQLGMDSRSQHRSQDMGVRQIPGPRSSPIQLVHGPLDPANDGSIFNGVDTTLTSILHGVDEPAASELASHLDGFRDAVADASAGLGAAQPWRATPALARGLGHLRAAEARAGSLTGAPEELGLVLDSRAALVERALLASAVVSMDVQVSDDLIVPGESFTIHVELWNGGPFTLTDAAPDLGLPEGWTARWATEEERQTGPRRSFFGGPGGTQLEGPGDVASGELARWSYRVSVPLGAAPSRQYYLTEPRDGAMYRWPADRTVWGLPRNPPEVSATVRTHLAGTGLAGAVAVAPTRAGTYLGVDQATGEFRKPALVVPAVSVAMDPPEMVWPVGSMETRSVTVVVRNDAIDGTEGLLALDLPSGWSADPVSQSFQLETPGASRAYTFQVRPTAPVTEGEHRFGAAATAGGREYTEGGTIVDYPHIERVVMYRPAVARVSAFPVQVADLRVGYIMGTGDDGPTALRQLGLQVEEMTPERVRAGAFADYDVVVLGVRAYEARPDLQATNDQLLDYVRAGGTVVNQYNQFAYSQGGFAPYPVSVSRDRVSVEDGAVTVLDADSPVLTGPNAIGASDFDGWVQERGLYFPNEWDGEWSPVLSMADPGEDPKTGSLLVASVGDGVYIYTSLSFFRQFPAGVPGAYRLFANLVSLTADRWNEHAAQDDER